ncbi:MAG: DUF309 domain-containing protein [Planctomycetota bacterium]|jgi:hypothetical protein
MSGARVCFLNAAEGPPALQAMVDAAQEGVAAAGGEVIEWDGGAPPVADGFLLAAPVLLFGLPGPMKTALDGWLDELARVIPRTGGKPVGYLATFAPDDSAILEAFDGQMRGVFAFLGMIYRGRAASFAAPGAQQPKNIAEVAVARRLGWVLAENEGFAGWPAEYTKGIELHNAGQHWQAHEAWEDLWIREEGELKRYYQGLIQVTAAFHHYGHENWDGMRKLLKDGMAKLERFRPFAQGLDVDAFLEELRPWRQLAQARTGNPDPITRIPDRVPEIALRAPGEE